MFKLNFISKISPDKLKIAIIIFIVALLICIALITAHKKTNHEVIEGTYSNGLNQIKVEIKGEVNKPGVYNVNEGLRVSDVIHIAGDITHKADTSKMSLASKVSDGMVIYVPIGEYHSSINDYATKKNMVVEVKGEVVNPGLYDVSEGFTVYNVITLAGGLTKKADTTSINLMETVKDGMTITIGSDNNGNGKISINNATKEELTTLTGIGEAKAESIIDYRIANGMFVKIEDLMKVSGISEKVFDKIKDQLCL